MQMPLLSFWDKKDLCYKEMDVIFLNGINKIGFWMSSIVSFIVMNNDYNYTTRSSRDPAMEGFGPVLQGSGSPKIAIFEG